MSEVHRHVMSISIAMAILLMLVMITFTTIIYTELVVCQRVCELIESRMIEIIAYAQFEGNVTVKLSFNDIVSRPFELYAINSSHIEIRVPLKYLSNIIVKRYITLPERVILNYTGLIPPQFTLVFREIDEKVIISVRL